MFLCINVVNESDFEDREWYMKLLEYFSSLEYFIFTQIFYTMYCNTVIDVMWIV